MILAFDRQTLAVIMVIICTLPILLLALWAIIVALKNRKKKAQAYKDAIAGQPKDEAQRAIFYKASGEEDNVVSINVQMNRLTVKVKDIELVNPEQLKELGANNVLLVGDEVKCSYGDRAEYIYKLME